MVIQVTVAAVLGRGFDEFGTEPHELAECVGYAEHGDETFERGLVGHHRLEVTSLTLHGVGDADEVGERGVRVACLGERLENEPQTFIRHPVGFEPGELAARVVEVLQSRADQVHRGGSECVICVHT